MSNPVIIGDATLYCGDCLDILPTLPKVDAVVTDPPYGVDLTAKQNKWVKNVGDGYESTDDTPAFVASVVVPVIELCRGIARDVVVTPGTRCLWLYPPADDLGTIFNKSGAGRTRWGFGCNHPILFYGKCPYLNTGKGSRPNSWDQPATDFSDKNGHPCPKPIGMMMWLVTRGSLNGETILDPFMGSGTTGVACAKLGRKFIGIEIEPKYFDIACRRVEEAYKQPRLFDEPKAKPVQTNLLDGAA